LVFIEKDKTLPRINTDYTDQKLLGSLQPTPGSNTANNDERGLIE